MIRARAPVRLDFAGGWTDVPPFSTREGGTVVNAAIALFVEAELELGGGRLRLHARDLNEVLELPDPAALLGSGGLPLLRAGLRMFPVGHCTLATQAEAPPGSGLGSSGALDVALVAALAHARREGLDRREIADYAWELETMEAGNPGGRQDQLAAALGGFNLMRFRDPDATVEPLRLDPAFSAELARRTVLCYTGVSRVSGRTIERVMQAYEQGVPRVTGALSALVEIAERMAEALVAGDLARVAALLSENWREQQALDTGMRTPEMARLEAAMATAGALGGKAAGSGAGGSMFFIAGGSVTAAVEAAEQAGARVLPVAWAREGVQVC